MDRLSLRRLRSAKCDDESADASDVGLVPAVACHHEIIGGIFARLQAPPHLSALASLILLTSCVFNASHLSSSQYTHQQFTSNLYIDLLTPTQSYRMLSALWRTSNIIAWRTKTQCNIILRSIHIEKRISELGINLPPPSSPRANYNIVCRAEGNMLYVSGHLPLKEDGKTLCTGRVGPESGGITVEKGYEAARYCGLNIISTLKAQVGDLDKIAQIVKVGYCYYHSYHSNLDERCNLLIAPRFSKTLL